MRNHVLLASLAALCASVSAAGASDLPADPPPPAALAAPAPVAPPVAVQVVPPPTYVYPYRYGYYGPRYYAPLYARYPYGHHYAYGSYSRGHRHW